MQSLRKAAQQALELLEEIHPSNMTPLAEGAWNTAITALRDALSDATCQESRQVEPVAWLIESYDIYAKRTMQRLVFDNPKNMQGVKITAYYAAPPQRKPLSTDMILATWVEECIPKRSTPELVVAFARAIERAHGIGGEE